MSDYNDTNILFEQLRENNYPEALAIARLYQERERSETIRYNDPQKGRGELTVSPLGVFDRSVL